MIPNYTLTQLTICSRAGFYERLQSSNVITGKVELRRSVLSSKTDAASFRPNTVSSGGTVALKRSLRDDRSGMIAPGEWETVALSQSL